jgi:UDP-N-acetylglucosamine 4,6-dehydratase
MFKNKILMITGGTGSFGKKILKRFLSTDVSEIRIFSRDEKKQDDLRRKLNNDKLKFYIGDVRDYDSVNQAMKDVNFVFHAAALKQVPSCEFYPLEAIKTNILGAENVMNSAINNGVERVVVLSTDKSVYPINAMGMSKALMEKCMISKARMQNKGGTIFCATRYGNVMASRGSVIPLFVSQLKNDEDLTITDPNMTRFLMSLDESVDLVLYAYKHGEQGSIYVQKSPASTINDLAQALIKIFNKKNRTKLIGTRLGEKLFETLISREEMARSLDLGKYYSIPYDNKTLNYSKYFNEGEELISTYEDYTSHNTSRLNIEQVKELLLSLDYIKDHL